MEDFFERQSQQFCRELNSLSNELNMTFKTIVKCLKDSKKKTAIYYVAPIMCYSFQLFRLIPNNFNCYMYIILVTIYFYFIQIQNKQFY
jgi:hypothetical protein